MTSKRSLAVLTAGLLICLFAELCGAADTTSNYEVIAHPDIVFAEVDGAKLLLDVLLPVGVENPPLVMFMHGGGNLSCSFWPGTSAEPGMSGETEALKIPSRRRA